MKLRYKILLLCLSMAVILYAFPLILFNTSSSDSGMGLLFITFFAFYPIASITYGVISGLDIKRLWWIPLSFAVFFPPLYSLVIKEMVWDLYFYSVIYVFIGYMTEAIVYFANRYIKRSSNNERDKI